jgi:hypothetical protein
VAQIRRNLAVYAGQHPGQPIQAVYLAEAEGPWTVRLGSALSVPVHAFDPLVGAAPDVPEPIRGRFTGAVGLLAGRSANALPIDFASPRQPQTQGDPAKRRLAIVGIVAAVLTIGLLGGGYVIASAATDEVEKLTQERDDLKAELERGEPDRTKLAAIDGWSAHGVNWLDELYELSKRMPEDDSVRVSSLTSAQIQPDKKRKQESQASLELKLAASSNPAGANLMSAYVQDNPAPNKYYAGTVIGYHGVNASNPNGKYNQSVTIKTKVNHREPNEYQFKMPFTPPKRPVIAAGSASSESKASPEVAPTPSEKKAAK